MNANRMSTTYGTDRWNSVVTNTPQNWGLMLFLGLLLIFGGLLALSSVAIASAVTILLLGWFLLFDGIIMFFSMFFVREGRFALATLGILYALLGAVIIANPTATLSLLTIIFAIAWTVSGLVRTFAAIGSRSHEGRGYDIAAGLATLLLGILVWVGWPEASLYILGLFIGFEFLILGIAWTARSFRLRQINREMRHA